MLALPKKSATLVTLALDGIEEFHEIPSRLLVMKVLLQFELQTAPYVPAKPLHHSQRLIHQDKKGGIVRIDAVINFELEREILGFCECVKILSPKHVSARIKRRLEKAALQYAAIMNRLKTKQYDHYLPCYPARPVVDSELRFWKIPAGN